MKQTPSNDPTPPKSNTQQEPSVEQDLLPRLKFMGLLLLFFSACALYYSLFLATSIPSDVAYELATDNVTTPAEMQQTSGIPNNAFFQLFQIERVNAYIVTASFALVGALCLLFTWKKKKQL